MIAVRYSEPVACNLTKAAVDDLAANVASKVGFEPGADLPPVVSEIGGKIIYRPIGEITDPSSGSIDIRSEGDFDIILALHTGPTRDRFTIGHELGHYVLHYLWPKSRGSDPGPVRARRYGTGRVEWEANWFSAGFLMPAKVFKSSSVELGGDVLALADRFQVSFDAARVRKETLGLR